MDACSQRIVDLERELILIDHQLLLPDTDHEQLAARRAELFAAITREEFLLSSCGGVGQPRKPDPRASVTRHLPCALCIPQAERGLQLRLQNRARYAEQVEGLRHDLKCLEEERLEAMACNDMQELATLDAVAPKYRWKLEATQGMVEFLTGVIQDICHLAADQRREWGAPILPP